MTNTVNVPLGVILWVQCFSGSDAISNQPFLAKWGEGVACHGNFIPASQENQQLPHHTHIPITTAGFQSQQTSADPDAGISPLQLREWVSLLVEHLFSSEIWSHMPWRFMRHTSAAISTPKAERQSFIQQSVRKWSRLILRCVENASVNKQSLPANKAATPTV